MPRVMVMIRVRIRLSGGIDGGGLGLGSGSGGGLDKGGFEVMLIGVWVRVREKMMTLMTVCDKPCM